MKCLAEVFTCLKNRIPLQHELALAKVYYVDGRRTEAESPSQFPFIATCLVAGALFHPQGHLDSASEVSLEAPSPRRDDDETIVLDITEPKDPRYCYVWCYKKDGETREYMGPLNENNLSIFRPQDPPRRYKVVMEETLLKLWPERNWTPLFMMPALHDILVAPSDVQGHQDSELVNLALNTEHVDEDVWKAAMDPKTRRPIRECLIARAREVEASPVRRELLQAAFTGEGLVDLSPWPLLGIEDVAYILKFRDISQFVKTVCVSSHIEDEDVKTLVDALPEHGCQELYVLESGEEYSQTLCIPEAHRALSTKVKDKLVLGHALLRSLNPNPTQSVPNYEHSGNPISQILIVVDGVLDGAFIGDAMLSPTRVVTGLYNLLRLWWASPKEIKKGSFSEDIALAFACASSTLPTILHPFPKADIGHFPGEALDLGGRCRHKGHLRPINQGNWTVLICGSSLTVPGAGEVFDMLKVGFVRTTKDLYISQRGFGTTASPGDFTVFSIKEFLHETTPAAVIYGPPNEVTRSRKAREDALAAQEKLIEMLESSIEDSSSKTENQSKPDIPLMDSFTPAEAYRLVRMVSHCVLGDPLSDEK